MARPLVCPHLVGLTGFPCPAYYEWFTGVGLEKELLCVACATRREGGETIALLELEAEALEDVQGLNADLEGVRGAPEVRVRLAPVQGRFVETATAGTVLDFAPVEAEPGTWLLVRPDGAVGRPGQDLCTVDLPPGEPDHEPWGGHALTPRLHVSRDGAFAAVTNDFGHHGRVYDLTTGACTFAFDGGDYHPKTVPLSFAFSERAGRTIAVHRTAWNRLDVADAATGEVVAEGERDLDCFHGRLQASPDGTQLLDDGWVWHPRGTPTVRPITLDAHVTLAERVHWWNHGQCWLDAERIALSGLGGDDDWMLDGARVFDVHGNELTAFAGPAGTFFGDGDRLFASTPAGLTVWDVEAGALVARIDGFCPTRQHRAGRELAELRDGTLRRWRY